MYSSKVDEVSEHGGEKGGNTNQQAIEFVSNPMPRRASTVRSAYERRTSTTRGAGDLESGSTSSENYNNNANTTVKNNQNDNNNDLEESIKGKIITHLLGSNLTGYRQFWYVLDPFKVLSNYLTI